MSQPLPASDSHFPRWWRPGFLLLLLFLALPRLAHVNLLWSDEDYHLTAALRMLHGQVPYRDFWYDKPPLAGFFYCLIGAQAGWPLRILDAAFVLCCCRAAYLLATVWWGRAEGWAAAWLLAFFTTFYLPSATIPFAVDALLLLPHLAAIYFARTRKPFLCGICCALGLLTNIKAVFVIAVCGIWLWTSLPLFAAGLILPLGIALAAGAAWGVLPGFYNQVWSWGLTYARGASNVNSTDIAVGHTAGWLGFHAALAAGTIFCLRDKPDRLRFIVWFAFSFLALLLGNHFAPRYYLQLLPVLVIFGARGIVSAMHLHRRMAVPVLVVLLAVPLVRFGPRYLQLIAGSSKNWSDAALDTDSRQAASIINARKRPGDTLFVWGYRPDVYVFTRLIPPGTFSDSQPLDGVPADRHLQSTEAILTGAAQQNRASLIQTRPQFLIDGLGLLNPALSPERFPELADWLRQYHLIQQTRFSRVYQLKPLAAAP